MTTPSRFVNTSGVGWTPTGGSAAPLNRITQSGLTFNLDVINGRSDLDIYDSSANIVGAKPTVTFAGQNVVVYASLVTGLGTITWTVGNADNPGGAGSVVYTMTPVMNPLGDISNPYAQYASGNLSFAGLAADGTTNPLTSTVVSSGMFLGTRAFLPPPGSGSAGAALLTRITASFAPPPPKFDILDGTPVDAVLAGPAGFVQGNHHFRNLCRGQVEAAKILGCDPDQVRMRRQGLNRIYTPTPHLTLYHPTESDFGGQHRLNWQPDRGDGVRLGHYTEDAQHPDSLETLLVAY